MSFTASLDDVVSENRSGLLAKACHWERVRLAEVAEILNGCAFSSSLFHPTEGVPLLRIRDVGATDTDAYYQGDFEERYIVAPGDLVVGMDGDFRCALWRGPLAVLNQRVCKITPDEDLFRRRFLLYALQPYLDAIHAHTSSVTVKHLSSKTVADIPLPLPPLGEQDRITAALEAHFTRLDAAVTALKRARANLKRYRASVLKAACEGRLAPTEAELARREGRDYEPADVLLDRILTQRRARWEAEELEKLKAKGKEPKDDRWKKKYKEPEGPDKSGLPELPEGWGWASMGQLSEVSGGLTQHRRRGRLERSIPYLRVANVYGNELRLDDVQEIGVKEAELDRVLLQAGDLLIVEGNGSLDQIGRVAIWDGSIDPCVHQNHLIKVRLIDRTLTSYVLLWLLSPPGRRNVTKVASSTSGLYTLSLSKVRALPVAIPPADEVDRIVCEVERQLSFFEATTGSLERGITRALRLHQSILNRAFEGRLVPQVPDDEPASTLLDRIQVEPASSSESASSASSTRT